MITKEIKDSSVFAEFDPQGQEYWFDRCKEKVVPHIDTFYYTVLFDTNYNLIRGYWYLKSSMGTMAPQETL